VSTSKIDGVEDKEPEQESVSLQDREPHKFLTLQQQVVALLSIAVTPEDMRVVRERFQAAARDDDGQNGGAMHRIIHSQHMQEFNFLRIIQMHHTNELLYDDT
jgi:hypothetical protein